MMKFYVRKSEKIVLGGERREGEVEIGQGGAAERGGKGSKSGQRAKRGHVERKGRERGKGKK